MQELKAGEMADGCGEGKNEKRRLLEDPPVKTDPGSSRSMISVVIPVFNEEKNLPELIRRCLGWNSNTGRNRRYS